MALTTRVIQFNLSDIGLNADFKGIIEIYPNVPYVIDLTTGQTILPVPKKYEVSVTNQTDALPTTDNTETNPGSGMWGYNFVIKEFPGAPPILSCTNFSLPSGGGAYTLAQALASGNTNPGNLTMPPVFNIMGYAALQYPNDCTTAVQAAQAAAIAHGGGMVFFPPGVWQFGTITIPSAPTTPSYLTNQVNFMFSGVGATVLTPNAANTPLFQVSSSGSGCAAGVRFAGGFTIKAHPSGSTGAAIDLTGARQFVIESLSYWDSSIGTSGTPGTYNWVVGLGNNAYANRIINPICEGQHIANSFIGVKAVTGIAVNNNTVENPLFESCTAIYMLDAAGTAELNVYNGIIEGNTVTAAIRLGFQTRVRGVHFESNVAFTMDAHGVDNSDPGSCWLENNVYNSGSGTLTIPSATAGHNVIVGTLSGLTVVDNTFSYIAINGGAFSGYGPALNYLLYTPFTGDATTGTISNWDPTRNYHRVVLTGNVTVGNAVGTQTNGQIVVFEFVQASSGGPFTVTFGGQFLLPSGFTQSSTASTSSTATFVYNSTLARWVLLSKSDNSSSNLPNVQFFTASGTWTKPAGAQTVHTYALAGAPGGGSGASGASGTALSGGGAAAGSAIMSREFSAADLGATVAVTVGAGGNGGAAVTGVSGTTPGNAGSAGATSSFGSFLLARPGTSGGGGGAAVAGTGGASVYGTLTGMGAGAASSASGAAGVGTNQTSLPSAPGGSAGGGITTGAVAGAGAGGNTSVMSGDAVAGTAGVVGGAAAGSGTASAVTNGSVGPSPGSGAASTTGAAGQGADALANSGAGGSGGGASLNGSASGRGSNGGSGWVLVITYFQ